MNERKEDRRIMDQAPERRDRRESVDDAQRVVMQPEVHGSSDPAESAGSPN